MEENFTQKKVTLEDVVEEIVGEIFNENDSKES
jgi:CBS domain containing-hemolysin-like protein